MSIAYASESNSNYIPAPFARAPYFIIVWDSTGTNTVIENPYRDIPGNASEVVVQFLYAQGINEVHAKDFGYRAIENLRQYGMQAYRTEGR